MEQKSNVTKKNKKIKFAIIFSAISALVLTILLVTLIPYGNMRKGTALINKGEYEKAYEVLDGNYLNSAKKMKVLAEAGVKYEKDNYKEGTRLIASNGGSVTVNYDYNGGEGPKEHEIIRGSNNIRVLPTYVGYKFNRFTVTDFSIDTKGFTANIDLQANWVAETYNVSVGYPMSNGGYSYVTRTLTYDQPYSFDFDITKGKKIVSWRTSQGQIIPATGIWTYTDIESMSAVVEWDTIELGSYPQSKVSENNTINALNVLAGTLPTSSNSYSWTSYGYYKKNSISNDFWYIDVMLEGKKYRGVYFTNYRSYNIQYDSYNSNYSNNFNKNTTYWFEFEPIKWIQFKIENAYYLMSEYVLDSQNFTFNTNYYYDQTAVHYSRSYVRTWLNDNFYNLAFTEQEKNTILTSTVGNSADDRYNTSDALACSTTYDKVFIPSAPEMQSLIPSSEYKRALGTDYAYSQGLYGSQWNNGIFAYYLTRTPGGMSYAYYVSYSGDLGNYYSLNYTDYGIRPCITIER